MSQQKKTGKRARARQTATAERLGRRWNEKRRERWAERATIFGGVAAVVALLCGAGAFVLNHLRDRGPQIKLSPHRLIEVDNPQPFSSSGGTLDASSLPTIRVALVNDGQQGGEISRAKVVLDDAAEIHNCVNPGGGDEPLAGATTFDLPTYLLRPQKPLEGELHASADPKGQTTVVGLQFRTERYAQMIYALRASLVVQGRTPIALGRFVIGVPGPLQDQGIALPDTDAAFLYTYLHLGLMEAWCMRRNRALLTRLLAHPGLRSPEIRALDQRHSITTRWSALMHQYPPRASAIKLLHRDGEGPTLAAYAAAVTGDKAFATRIKAEAAQIRLSRAQHDLSDPDESPTTALIEAEGSLQILYSSQADTLRRAATAKVDYLASHP
jgi:hypothetical protein